MLMRKPFLQYIPYQLRTQQRDIINNFYTFFDVISHTHVYIYIRNHTQHLNFEDYIFVLRSSSS